MGYPCRKYHSIECIGCGDCQPEPEGYEEYYEEEEDDETFEYDWTEDYR